MEFIMTVDCHNAAFDEYPATELARIMRYVADQIDEGIAGSVIHDVNGNRVGRWEVT